MAQRSFLKTPFLLPLLFDLFGFAVVGCLLFFAFQSDHFILSRPYYFRVLLFTLFQAFTAATLVVGFSLLFVSTARKLASTLFGNLFNHLISIPFFIPSLIGCLSLVLFLGQSGFLARTFSFFHLPFHSFLYGIGGILACHLFYYIPFTLKQFSLSLNRCPGEYERLAESLSLSSLSRFRLLYLPFLKKEILPAFILTFLFCLRSFTTIMIFGGKPENTTLEVALFQALNFDLDWSLASQICLLQLAVNSSLFLLSTHWKKSLFSLPSSGNTHKHIHRLSWIDKVLIFSAFLFFGLPLALLSWRGVLSLSFFSFLFQPSFWIALGNSLIIGLLTACFGFLIASFLVYGKYLAHTQKKKKLLPFVSDVPAHLAVIFSPLVFGTSFFILFSGSLGTAAVLFILALLNAISFLPTLYRILSNAFLSQRERFDPLCASLSLVGWNRWRLIDWTGLKSSAGYAFSVCLLFSLGDARSILFFNQNHFPTLISLIYQQMKSYHFSEATALSAWLIIFSFLLFSLIQKIFGKLQR